MNKRFASNKLAKELGMLPPEDLEVYQRFMSLKGPRPGEVVDRLMEVPPDGLLDMAQDPEASESELLMIREASEKLRERGIPGASEVVEHINQMLRLKKHD